MGVRRGYGELVRGCGPAAKPPSPDPGPPMGVDVPFGFVEQVHEELQTRGLLLLQGDSGVPEHHATQHDGVIFGNVPGGGHDQPPLQGHGGLRTTSLDLG